VSHISSSAYCISFTHRETLGGGLVTDIADSIRNSIHGVRGKQNGERKKEYNKKKTGTNNSKLHPIPD
jgi:hypothetical protein